MQTNYKKELGFSPILKGLIWLGSIPLLWILLRNTVESIAGILFFLAFVGLFVPFAAGWGLKYILSHRQYSKTFKTVNSQNLSPQWGFNSIGTMLVDEEKQMIVYSDIVWPFSQIKRMDTHTAFLSSLEIFNTKGECITLRSPSRALIRSTFVRLESSLGW